MHVRIRRRRFNRARIAEGGVCPLSDKDHADFGTIFLVNKVLKNQNKKPPCKNFFKKRIP